MAFRLISWPSTSWRHHLPANRHWKKVKGFSAHLGPSSLQQPEAQNPEDNWVSHRQGEASSQHIIPGPLKVPMQHPTKKAPRGFYKPCRRLLDRPDQLTSSHFSPTILSQTFGLIGPSCPTDLMTHEDVVFSHPEVLGQTTAFVSGCLDPFTARGRSEEKSLSSERSQLVEASLLPGSPSVPWNERLDTRAEKTTQFSHPTVSSSARI